MEIAFVYYLLYHMNLRSYRWNRSAPEGGFPEKQPTGLGQERVRIRWQTEPGRPALVRVPGVK